MPPPGAGAKRVGSGARRFLTVWAAAIEFGILADGNEAGVTAANSNHTRGDATCDGLAGIPRTVRILTGCGAVDNLAFLTSSESQA